MGMISKVFYETVVNEFAFLMEEYSFKGPFSDFKICEERYVYKIWFMGRTLAIEFVLDQRDEDVSCLIVRLENGQLPSGLYVNERGERVRVYLELWLREKGFKEPFLKVKNKNLTEKIDLLIRDYARLLRMHGDLVLQDRADEVFSRVSGRLSGLQGA